jgi:hypothetical protein
MKNQLQRKHFQKTTNWEKNIHPLDGFIATIEDNSNRQLEEVESPH